MEANVAYSATCGQSQIGPTQTFFTPEGLAVDSGGNLWVANSGNDTITEICLASSTPPCNQRQSQYVQAILTNNLSKPSRLVFDKNWNLYVANTGSDNEPILEFTQPLSSTSVPNVIYDDSISRPLGIAVDENYLYIVNNKTGSLSVKDLKANKFLPPYSLGKDTAPGAIALVPNGLGMIIGNGPTGRPTSIDLFSLPLIVNFQKSLAVDAHYTGPTGIAIAPQGVFVSDLYSGNAVVYQNKIVSMNSIPQTSPLIELENSQTGYSEGIAFVQDSTNPQLFTVYVANSAFNSISVFFVNTSAKAVVPATYYGSYQ